MIKLFVTGFLVLILNIPFGYWRANVRRFHLQWFLAVHIPVVLVIAFRLGAHLGFGWTSYAVLVTAFILGQQFGSFNHRRLKQIDANVSSCLIMDLVRHRGH